MSVSNRVNEVIPQAVLDEVIAKLNIYYGSVREASSRGIP